MTDQSPQGPAQNPGEQPGQQYGQPQPQVVYVQQPKKKGGCLKWGAIVVGVFIVLMIIIAAAGGGDSDSDPVSADASKAKDGGKSGEDQPEYLQLGETYTTKGDLDVTVNSFGPETDALGSQVVCAAVEYVNNGSGEVDFEGYWDWKVQNPQGVITDPSFSGDDTLMSGKVAPGGNLSGRVCFDGSEPGEYIIKYDPSLSFSSENAKWKASF